MKLWPRYETGLAILLGMTFSIVLFDRNAIAALAPYIVDDLKLTNAQFGIAASILSISWAISGLVVGRLSDRAGRRKPFLLAAIILFSLASMLSGLAGGFLALVAIRLLMGFAEGPVPTLNSALVISTSGERRRGLNMGLNALAGGLLGLILSPVLLVAWAEQFGWRGAFFLAGVPGLLMAVVVALFVKEPRRVEPTLASGLKAGGLRDVAGNRNVFIAAAVASFMFAGMWTVLVFLPLYTVKVLHADPAEAAVLGLVFAAVGIVMGLVGPLLSDRFGRKPVAVICVAASVLLPLGCLTYPQPLSYALMGAGMLLLAAPAIVLQLVPAESVRAQDRGAAIGLVVGSAEVVGAFGGPALSGVAADTWGLASPFYIATGCLLAATALSFLLRETAPRRRGVAESPADSIAANI